MKKVEQAVACFKEGFSCSQAVCATYGIDFGLGRDDLLKISSAFGAGMARLSETCGACTGAMMVLGLKYGRTRAEDNAAKEKTYQLVQEFAKRFKARNGTLVCRELLGVDMGTPEGIKAMIEKNLHATACPKFVKDAAEILEEIL